MLPDEDGFEAELFKGMLWGLAIMSPVYAVLLLIWWLA